MCSDGEPETRTRTVYGRVTLPLFSGLHTTQVRLQSLSQDSTVVKRTQTGNSSLTTREAPSPRKSDSDLCLPCTSSPCRVIVLYVQTKTFSDFNLKDNDVVLVNYVTCYVRRPELFPKRGYLRFRNSCPLSVWEERGKRITDTVTTRTSNIISYDRQGP